MMATLYSVYASVWPKRTNCESTMNAGLLPEGMITAARGPVKRRWTLRSMSGKPPRRLTHTSQNSGSGSLHRYSDGRSPL